MVPSVDRALRRRLAKSTFKVKVFLTGKADDLSSSVVNFVSKELTDSLKKLDLCSDSKPCTVSTPILTDSKATTTAATTTTTVVARNEVILDIRVAGVDFDVESVRQKFERTVCGLFKTKQEGCSVQFKAQAKEVKVELKFSDEAEARAASTIEPSDFESRLAAALSQKNDDDSAVDASAFKDMKVDDLSAQYAQKPQVNAGEPDDDSPSSEILILAFAIAAVVIIVLIIVIVVIVKKNADAHNMSKTMHLSPKASVYVDKERQSSSTNDTTS